MYTCHPDLNVKHFRLLLKFYFALFALLFYAITLPDKAEYLQSFLGAGNKASNAVSAKGR